MSQSAEVDAISRKLDRPQLDVASLKNPSRLNVTLNCAATSLVAAEGITAADSASTSASSSSFLFRM